MLRNYWCTRSVWQDFFKCSHFQEDRVKSFYWRKHIWEKSRLKPFLWVVGISILLDVLFFYMCPENFPKSTVEKFIIFSEKMLQSAFWNRLYLLFDPWVYPALSWGSPGFRRLPCRGPGLVSSPRFSSRVWRRGGRGKRREQLLPHPFQGFKQMAQFKFCCNPLLAPQRCFESTVWKL